MWRARARRQAPPEKRDQLARLVDVAYSERSPEQRDRLYQWILRASPAEVRRVEALAHERVRQAYADWELEREADVMRQYEDNPGRPFAFSRFLSPLRDSASFLIALRVGAGADERIACYIIEAKPDADPEQLAQRIRDAAEQFDAAILSAPELSPLLQ